VGFVLLVHFQPLNKVMEMISKELILSTDELSTVPEQRFQVKYLYNVWV